MVQWEIMKLLLANIQLGLRRETRNEEEPREEPQEDDLSLLGLKGLGGGLCYLLKVRAGLEANGWSLSCRGHSYCTAADKTAKLGGTVVIFPPWKLPVIQTIWETSWHQAWVMQSASGWLAGAQSLGEKMDLGRGRGEIWQMINNWLRKS